MRYIDMQNGSMPALGLGTWQLTGRNCVQAVRTAIDIGYRHIDTAQIYENEAEVGRAIEESGIARKELFVTTKLWTTHLTTADVATSMEESLSKLRTEHVDLLLIHWPNPAVPLSETLEAMQALLHKGKIRAIGVSNFPVRLMREVVEICKAPITCNQIEYHALLPQPAVLNYARANGIIVTAYSPLARGQLANHPLFIAIGKKYGKSAGQVALRWLIEQPGVAAIPKAASEQNARRNFDIFDFELSDADRKAIAGLNAHKRIVDPAFAPEWDAV